ncbi:MAG TPA: hypothetical protein VN901_16935 [Candidatus Acidoferrales bacterium]|nr:hypothetical protein [Candidatus Acidoferrales bacterium]
MQIEDKHDWIAKWGQHAVVILGNVAKRDYEVVDLEAGPLGPEYHANFAERGLGYVATFGLMLGQFRYAYAVPLEAEVIVTLAEDYSRFVLAKLTNPSSKRPDDGVEWLAKLWSLEDHRMGN